MCQCKTLPRVFIMDRVLFVPSAQLSIILPEIFSEKANTGQTWFLVPTEVHTQQCPPSLLFHPISSHTLGLHGHL